MFKLPDLPYAYDALQPTMSAETLHLHHDKHHAAYVKTTNELVEKEGLSGRTLEEVVAEARRGGKTKLFNNAAQAWNHAFFWNCMTPGGAEPNCVAQQRIERIGEGDDQDSARRERGARGGEDEQDLLDQRERPPARMSPTSTPTPSAAKVVVRGCFCTRSTR